MVLGDQRIVPLSGDFYELEVKRTVLLALLFFSEVTRHHFADASFCFIL